ncbi:MAG: hypothetical protein K2Y42_06705 [Hyphomicrobium sp.]|jgi:hypothetical protein|uniref:hypothetical protein n=1 Tax=Hyphomicrobium sp. TaxID=82 RepID=UPI0025BD60BD|nr:hypothetical protein [Hyphomicrobium sp.]MBX9862428.1 hypothetical protein [Hyphomicrobium sp.]
MPRKPHGAKTLLIDGLIVLGVLGSLGLVAVSTLLNYRFGFRLGGTDEVERQLYGLGFGCADIVKALMPFCFALALVKRDYLAAVGAGVFFIVASVSSFYAGIGLAAEHRLANEGTNSGILTSRTNLQAEQKRLEGRLEVIGRLGTPKEVENAIEAAYAQPYAPGQRTVAVHSDRCRKNMVSTREACANIAALNVTLEQAREAQEARKRLAEAQAALGMLDSSVQSKDPQLDVIDRVLRWFDVPVEQADIRTGLLLGLGLLLELGSGLGLYTVTTPWRHREGDFRKKMTILGDAAVWADERLQVVQGGRLTANMVFADYETWCRARNYVAMREGVFVDQLMTLASEVGMPMEQSGSNLEFRDVGLGAGLPG